MAAAPRPRESLTSGVPRGHRLGSSFMKRRFQISLCKEQLTFSAAHFITVSGDICESLHGHNFGVRCDVEGRLTTDRYVIDFIALRDALAEIVRELDHHVLLPTRHPLIRVLPSEREVLVQFRERRWIFPAEDCRLLPVANTTAEELAQFIGDQLLKLLRNRLGSLIGVTRLVVGVDENQGQWGLCTLVDDGELTDDSVE